jgi:UDP-N-acetylglucosamine--N-acetylmuramyl-(pentapeptide) pyrophosphoryl-undecaprenol N-acetylglucosamine transferase
MAMCDSGRRVFLAGGGTGGHLYPGLAVAEALRLARPDTAIAFSTTRKAIDRHVLAAHDYPATPIAAEPFRPHPWTWPRLAASLARTWWQTWRRFRQFCPEVVVGLGGYGSFAPVRQAQRAGLATVVLNPDIVPGRANRRLGRRADLVACQFQETLQYFGPAARLTGCPVRPGLLRAGRRDGMAALGLDASRRTLLVTGASSGAQTVNRAVLGMLRENGLPPSWQVLHLTGESDYETVAAAYQGLNVSAVVRPYLDDMGLAYAAADLAVARAGASTLAELLALGVPAVFLPYPFHRDRHQMRQARAVEMQGAAVVVRDRPDDPAATSRELAEAVEPLLRDEVRRATMRRDARRVARPDAAAAIAGEVLRLADAAAARRHEAIRADVDRRPPAPYTPAEDTIP